MKILLSALCFLVIVTITASAQEKDFSKLSGPYLGQKHSGTLPQIFAPGIVSTSNPDICISFTPDGKEVYYTMGGQPHSVILFMKEEKGVWSSPEVAPFSGMYSSECQLSPDGNTMYFCAGIPASGSGNPKGNWDLFKVDRINGEWGKPLRLPYPLASDEYSADCPSVAANGNIYFYSSNYPGGFGKGDIYVSRLINDKYQTPENLGANINTEFYDMDPFIAPDENYIIFSSIRPGGQGENDLYISFKNSDGSWGMAVNMGKEINSYAHEIHPYVSRDGKYLFFCSKRRISYKRYSERPLNFKEKMEWTKKPGNELEDIYWVDAKLIEELRRQYQK
ncbi:MAG: hypothetical protein KKG99_01070 [Bacteroidetes bacterium]|nr:hypothetical protein [Bacteroidota bacterium]